jgi:hypothetical protein
LLGRGVTAVTSASKKHAPFQRRTIQSPQVFHQGNTSTWRLMCVSKKARIVAESFEQGAKHIRGRAATRNGARAADGVAAPGIKGGWRQGARVRADADRSDGSADGGAYKGPRWAKVGFVSGVA